MKKRLFGSTGIRGRVFGPVIAESNIQFTPETLIRLGMAWSHFNKMTSDILVGKDPRISSDMIQAAVTAGIMAMGRNVLVHDGILPTPALNYACKINAKSGVMITGSHTPPEMNALKFLTTSGAEIDTQTGEQEIEALFFDPHFRVQDDPLKCGSIQSVDLLPSYLDYLNQSVSLDLSELTIVLDPGNGCMAGGIISNLLSNFGATVITVNDLPDGHFPGRGPEPLLPESLERLSHLVIQIGANLGIAYDSDGDRCIFVDNKGRMVWGDYTLALVAKIFLHKGDTLATPVSTAGIIEDVANASDFHIKWTAVGAAEVTRICLEQNLPLGGEQNGGIIFPHDNPARDGGRTTLEILKLITESNQSLSTMVDALPKYYITKEKVHHPENLLSKRSMIMDELLQHYSDYKAVQLDGVKLQFDESSNTSCLLRFSMTEPIFRVFTNGKDKQTMLNSHQECVSIVKNLIKEYKSKFS